ncbi:ABC transporter ATP-binding protein [Haloprofundus halobius]|uniref:ABC transporter ATP-binding protein n=1 Tax=Haloprofundus halobius TaxID=2876194 RepID=UPI001CCBA4B6|nr:ABC transporter ATP-binding protein [Haloprofundus halobius]
MTDANTSFQALADRVERPIQRVFAEYGVPELRWLTLGVLTSFLSRAANLVPPLLLGVTLNAVESGPTAYSPPLVPDAWLPETVPDQLSLSIALIAASFLVAAVASWGRTVTLNLFAHRIEHFLRVDTYERMQALDMAFFDDKQTGEIMSVLNNDVNNLEVFFDNALESTIRLVVMVLGIAGVLFYLNRQLAVVTLVFVPVLAGFTYWFMTRVEPVYAAVRSSVGGLNTRLENNLSGIDLIKTTATEGYEGGRVRDASKEYFDQTMTVIKLSGIYQPGMQFIGGMTFLATFAVGGYWLVVGPPPYASGTLQIGTFVTFVTLAQQLVAPVSESGRIVEWYENALASTRRIYALRDMPTSIDDPVDPVSLGCVEGRVEYDSVSFSYDVSEQVLDDVNFAVEPGETLALVGPTGAGKSTILKLLPRLYDVNDGLVRVDGVDVRDTSLSELRGAIGYVGQETFLFDGTVAENLRYGAFDATDEEMVAAAKVAEAHEFIEDLPEGYDTRIGERGVKLSGGQRQRLSIARTALADAPILILDEATSAVDTETERRIQRGLERLTEDRTTLVIAHRLSTVTNADQILVLDDGRIVERGSHRELHGTDSEYASLWAAQAAAGDSHRDR